MTILSLRTQLLVKKLFPTIQQADVSNWLSNKCGENLPFQKGRNEYELERIRFATLKISNGDPLKLLEAIELAKQDWRDVLMWAEFGNSLDAHEAWAISILETP